MNEKHVQVFFDKISPVKIVSTVWLNNNQIIVCCKGNTIFRHEVFEGKYTFTFFYYKM